MSATCCLYPPGPAYPVYVNGVLVKRIILNVECELVGSEMDGVGLTVNANPSCPCELPVATTATTWGRVKALYR